MNIKQTIQERAYADQKLLDPVRAPQGWGVFASVGPNFRHAVFGRDSIEVAEDVLEYDQALARDVILTLARLQGTTHNPDSEEEPGKIHHEYRSAQFAGRTIPAESLAIMRRLQAKKWSDAATDTMIYYGAHDATPLYIRLVQKYTGRYGDEILAQTYTGKDGRERTIMDSLQAATDWLTGKLLSRDDRLLAYRRSNPEGIENQVWKDSPTAYLFGDGTLPDFAQPIVSTELQGYTYDALLYAARLFPARARQFRQLARQIQRSTIQKLWLPGEQFFAQGIATHQSGGERVIDTLTSNGALLLDSQLLDNLSTEYQDAYVDGIETMVLSQDFLTPAGIRCRAARHAELLPYVDYHGSYAVWPKETADIARGLERHGRKAAGVVLRQAILDGFSAAGDFYELFYVDLANRAFYDQTQAIARFSSENMGEPLPVPEPGQAWSISAAIASANILRRDAFRKPSLQRALKNFWRLPPKRLPWKRSPLPQLISSVQAVLARRK